MKKTLITLLALSGIAMGETNETVTMDLLPESANDVTIHGTYTSKAWYSWANLKTLENVVTNVGHDVTNTPESIIDGWSAQAQKASMTLDSSYITIEDNGALTFLAKGGTNGGTALTYVMDVADLTSSATTGTVTKATSLTFDFNFSTINDTAFALATIDGTDDTVTALHALTANELTTGDTSFTFDNLDLDDDDRIMLIIRSGASGLTSTIESLSLTADVVTTPTVTPGENVPEPTTATLSLLALAGLAARRRRR